MAAGFRLFASVIQCNTGDSLNDSLTGIVQKPGRPKDEMLKGKQDRNLHDIRFPRKPVGKRYGAHRMGSQNLDLPILLCGIHGCAEIAESSIKQNPAKAIKAKLLAPRGPESTDWAIACKNVDASFRFA